MKRIAFFIASLGLAVNVAQAQQAANEWVNGHWTGVGYQHEVSTWSISLLAEAGAQEPFLIAYPSLDCGGYWTLERTEGGTLWFRETITFGHNNCENQVSIAVTRLSEDYITFTCFSPWDGHLSSYSTLKREPMP